MERVLVRRVGDVAAAVREALDFLEYDFRDQRVWVKPNLIGPHVPSEGVTTEPEIVRSVVRELKKRGARDVWVADNPGGAQNRQIESFVAKTGVIEASEGCFRNAGVNPIELPIRSRFVSSVRAASVLNEVDVIVNLPVFKTHALTILTGAMKNMFGIVVGAQKSYLHSLARSTEDFSELMVDIYGSIPKPMLHIMDALRGMDGQMGPSGGRVLKLGLLLGARNGVALDSVMAVLAGTSPASVPMIRIAGERGLGPVRPEDIEIVGERVPLPGFRLPSQAAAKAAGGLSSLVYPLLLRRPIPIPNRCTRCRECYRGCPVKAIRMEPTPVIDRKTCISCFCCVELCPERAFRIPNVREAVWRNLTRR